MEDQKIVARAWAPATLPRMASVTSSAPPSRNACFSSAELLTFTFRVRVPLGGGLPGLHTTTSLHRTSLLSLPRGVLPLPRLLMHPPRDSQPLSRWCVMLPSLPAALQALQAPALRSASPAKASGLLLSLVESARLRHHFPCSGPLGSVYGPTSLPVDWIEDKCFRCDRIQCLRRNAWPRLFPLGMWMPRRLSVQVNQAYACSMSQPDTVFLVGCAMLAGLIENRGHQGGYAQCVGSAQSRAGTTGWIAL